MYFSDGSLTIGSLAKAARVTTPTIRYYEEIGLLPLPVRTNGGQRKYDRTALSRLTFIRQFRDFGFSIDQIRVLLDLSLSPDRDCSQAREVAVQHLAEVRGKLTDLRALERQLQHFVDRCTTACAGGPGRDCVVFKDLVAPKPCS